MGIISLENRFWDKVDKRGPDECWNWLASVLDTGYGQFALGKKCDGGISAHRMMYQLTKGDIPQGLVIDHLCRNRKCVNPNHLEAVTQRENLMRADCLAARQMRRTHCPQGHEYTPENTRMNGKNGRMCRECGRALARRYYHETKNGQNESVRLGS